MSQQTLIPIGIHDDISLDSFYGDNSQILIKEISSLICGDRHHRVIYFWGERGSGKTHLLHGACQFARTLSRPFYYFTPGDAAGSSRSGIDALERLTSDTLLCVDDFQLALKDDAQQEQLLGLYEKLVAQGSGGLVVAADQPLSALDVGLKDLHSRLSLGGVFNVTQLDDSNKRQALLDRACNRGINLDDHVLDFIMSHYERDTVSLFSLLDKLDNASLQSHRRITIPFLKTLI